MIDDANTGQPETVDLNQYVTNPFADQGKPITVVGAPRLTAGKGSVSLAGTTVTVTPAAGFNGQLTVTYTVADATGSPQRQVRGRILLTVRDRPDPPVAVIATTTESRTAVVSWTAGSNNGAEITNFTVSWNGGTQSCGAVTTCTVSTLTNNVKYSFRVVATNEVEDSDPSAPSNEVRPDEKPSQPAPPVTTFGDQQIEVNWTTPPTEGSPVKAYTLEIDGPTGGITQKLLQGGGSTSVVWTGLTNGATYRFRVQAINDAPDPSEWSDYSVAEIPAGPPLDLIAPSVDKDPVSALDPTATVSWPAPNGNGDDAMTYELRRVGGGIAYTGTQAQARLTLQVSQENQQFEFRATNKAGSSEWSPASSAVRGFSRPGTVTGLTAEATGADNSVRVTFGSAAGNGARPEEITYVWRAGGDEGVLNSGDTIRSGSLGNGSNVSIAVLARSDVAGESIAGDSVTSNTVVPYGPPRAPTVSASGGVNEVTLSWDGGAAGNGRRIVRVQIETTDRGTQDVGISGSDTQGNGRNQTKSIRARAVDELGNPGDWSGYATASTWGNPSYEWQKEASAFANPGQAGCPSIFTEPCHRINLILRDFNPNSSVNCFVEGVGAGNWSRSFRVDGGGDWGWGQATGVVAVSSWTVDSSFGDCTQG